MMRARGVMMYIVPSTTIGVTSKDRCLPVRIDVSPVWYVQATASCFTETVSICASGE